MIVLLIIFLLALLGLLYYRFVKSPDGYLIITDEGKWTLDMQNFKLENGKKFIIQVYET